MSDPIIEVRDLRRTYRRVVAVDGVSFTVDRGQVFGFLGPNGSGKTTTIGMLLGIITPTAGTIRLFGTADGWGLYYARQRIGGTLETPNFYPYLSGRDNLRIAANLKGAGESEVGAMLDRVGLGDRGHHRFATYSLGMKQRLALAATMLGDPEVVVLDEPANGLDPDGMRDVREIILGLAAEGRTIFLSSHLLSEVERVCTHVAILRKGRIVRQASIAQIREGAAIAELAAPDADALDRALATLPMVQSITREGELTVVKLAALELAELSRLLSEQGVFLSHLAARQATLEDAFIAATGPGAAVASELGTATGGGEGPADRGHATEMVAGADA